MAAFLLAAVNSQPIQQFMIRKSQSGKSVSEQPLSRSGLYNRLVKHLSDLGCYEGESMHSFRRGMAQHHAAAGHPPASIKQKMLLRTHKISTGTNLPAGRHDSGVKRLRSAAGQAVLLQVSRDLTT